MKTYQSCKLLKTQVDNILKEMASLFTNLGTESTEQEIADAYRKEGLLIDKIVELDPAKASSIRPYEN